MMDIQKSAFRLDNDTLHLWKIDLLTMKEMNLPSSLLNIEESDRMNRLHFVEHRQIFAAARKTLKLILSIYTHSPAELLEFLVGGYGKPYLEHSRLAFNLSHTGQYLFLGITLEHAVGVDIEQMKSRDFMGLANHSFSVTEQQQLREVQDSHLQENFYKIWCQKEAFIKQCGMGLSYPLKSFSVSSKSQGGILAPELCNISLDCQWFQYNDSVMGAICLPRSIEALRWFTTQDLVNHETIKQYCRLPS